MKHLNTVLESKFSEILSGQCLTSIREENRKILQSNIIESRETDHSPDSGFTRYIQNFLRIRGYDILESGPGELKAQINDETHDFFIDFDHGHNEGELLLKIAVNGEKKGISKTECKYVLIISIEKKMIFLMSINHLKNSAKEKKPGYKVFVEQTDSDKIQYLSIDLIRENNKYKAFVLK